jgi:hypothetical protein
MASNKAARREYEAALSVVQSVLASWDPYCLLEEGAPADEFEAEASALVPRLLRGASSEDAAMAVSEVFSKAFGSSEFSSAECAAVGERLYVALIASGHIK